MKSFPLILTGCGLLALTACGGGTAANNAGNAANVSGPAVGTSLNDNSGIPPVDTSGADIPAFDNEAAPTAANKAANVSVANSIGGNASR